MFTPKRSGTGWTVTVAQPLGTLVLLSPVSLVLLPFILGALGGLW